MADIPKHLLERAAARRAALSGAEAPAAEAAASANPAPAAAVPAVAEAAAPAVAAGGGGAATPPPAAGVPATAVTPPAPRGMSFARIGSVFMLVALPVWLFFMFNTFSVQGAAADTPEAIGARIFAANCQSCHLANGAGSDQGGVGRPLYNGEVEKTFPKVLDQFAFVRHGSCGVGVNYGNAKREGGQHVGKGGMPAFATATLSDAELLAVLNYERHVLAGKAFPANELANADADEAALATVVPEADITTALEGVKYDTADVCGK